MSQHIEIARANEYPTVLVGMVDGIVYEDPEGHGTGTWSATVSFLERTYQVYFADNRVLDHVRGLAQNIGRSDKESCLARIVAFRGFKLPSAAGGQPTFYAQELVS